jgi:DNA-binding response OmpR family regulator
MKKILIIEDEAKISRFLQLELEHEGYTTEIVSDGREGYKKASAGKYDLIILDLMLPNLSGIEVCRRMRAETSRAFIMMTKR